MRWLHVAYSARDCELFPWPFSMFLFTLFGKQLFTVVMEILIIIVDPWLEFLIVAQDIYSAKGKGIWSSLRCQ